MTTHRVLQGECLASIAALHGFAPATIWDHPENARLKAARDPDVLLPGDALFIPELRLRTEVRPTGARHVFRRLVPTARLQVRLLAGTEPRNDEAYVLEIDGARREGKTDADGWIREPLLPRAKEAVLSLRDGEEQYRLRLGHLDPVETTSGVQARLLNLGLFDGAVDGAESDDLREALGAFQEAYELEVTGAADDATTAKLREMHGS